MHAVPLIVIAGPTASGKTAWAHGLARALGGELVGADSVQVYRRLDIGSAKPTTEELDDIRHHLIDVVDLDAPYDASRYMADADAAIAEVHSRGRVPVVVGGTGLYLRALVTGLAQGIPADPVRRAALHARIAAGGRDELARMHDELRAVDPAYAARIHPTDPIRIVRALEVFAASGVALSEHHRRHAAEGPRYRARFMAIDIPRDVLRARVVARTDAMLARGWINEVAAILRDGYDPALKPLQSVGYAEVVAHLRGELPASELRDRVVFASMAFAKRQRNWFRSEAGVTWVAHDATDALRDELARFVEEGAPVGG